VQEFQARVAVVVFPTLFQIDATSAWHSFHRRAG
jgi:hypothetical protein